MHFEEHCEKKYLPQILVGKLNRISLYILALQTNYFSRKCNLLTRICHMPSLCCCLCLGQRVSKAMKAVCFFLICFTEDKGQYFTLKSDCYSMFTFQKSLLQSQQNLVSSFRHRQIILLEVFSLLLPCQLLIPGCNVSYFCKTFPASH